MPFQNFFKKFFSLRINELKGVVPWLPSFLGYFITFICIVKRRAGNNQPLELKKGMAGITARFF